MKIGTVLKALAVAGGAIIGIGALKQVADYQDANDDGEETTATEIETDGETKEEAVEVETTAKK